MSPGAPRAVRPVTAADGPALAGFACRSWDAPWTDLVEEMVHGLAGVLAEPRGLTARGLWEGDALAAVVAWRIEPASGLCSTVLVAVHSARRRRGYARTLRMVQIDEARRAGCRAVVTTVHRGDAAAVALDRSLGGALAERPGDDDHVWSVIPV